MYNVNIPTVYPTAAFLGSKLHVPVICLAYPYHDFFLLCGKRPENEIQVQPVIDLNGIQVAVTVPAVSTSH